MRLLRIGFVAAVVMAFAGHAMAADAPKLNPEQRTQGMKEAPAVVQQAGLTCSISDAYFVGTGAQKIDGKNVDTKVYEVACKDGLGYFISAAKGAPPQTFDCLSLKTVADNNLAKGQKDSQRCILPENANPAQGLAPLLAAKANPPCSITNGRYAGSSAQDKVTLYETRCSDGRGYLILSPDAGSQKTLSVVGCPESALFGIKCTLTSDAEIKQQIIAMAKPANPASCQPTDARWVMATVDGSHYYEIACADGKSGYIFAVSDTGAPKGTPMPCAKAEQVNGGCTLTSIDVAKTQEAGIYTQQTKQIGYPCTVTKYQSLGPETAKTSREVVELACSEHAGSVWTFLPTGSGGDAVVVNCLRSEAYGLPACKLTPMSATYTDLGAQLKSQGKTCSVTNARYIEGVRTQEGEDFVEAACSEGSGYIIGYLPSPIEKVKEVFTCKEAVGTTRACTLSK